MPTISDLGKLVKSKHPGAYDDIPDADLGQRIKAKYPGSYDDFQGLASPAGAVGPPPQTAFGSVGPAMQQNPLFQFVNAQRHALPAYGAIAAQAIPGLEGPGGIAAGGAVGRAIQQATNPAFGESAPSGPLQALGQQAMSGAGQAGLALGPQALAEDLKPVAARIMQSALGRYGQKGLEAAQTALQERIGPGFRGKAPAQAQALIDALRGQVNNMLQSAKAQGLWHDPQEIVKGSTDLLSDPGLTTAEKSKIAGWNDELLQGKVINPGTSMQKVNPIDPVSLNRIRQRYDNEAQAIYNAAKEKNYIPPAEKLRAQWAAGIANKARTMLQDTQQYPNAVPGLQEVQGRLGDAINLKTTLTPVEKKAFGRFLPYAPGLGASTIGYVLPAQSWHERIAHAAIAGAAASPQGMSNLSLLLTQPGGAEALSAILRGAGAASDMTQQNLPQESIDQVNKLRGAHNQ